VLTGRRNRVVVPREHRLWLRVPEAALGPEGALIVRSGMGRLELPAAQAARQKHGHLLFEVPVRKGEPYSVALRKDGRERAHLVHGVLTAAIDAAQAAPGKHAPCGKDASFAPPGRPPARRAGGARLGAFRPCPHCEPPGGDGDEESG
jgi:hypothetical protein